MGNLLGGMGNLFSGVGGNSQKNAAAAKILNKSPLELNDNSATSHLDKDPFSYGIVHYPSEITNLGTGHYMIFDIILNQKTKFLDRKNTGTTPTFLSKDITPLADLRTGGLDLTINEAASRLANRITKVDTGLQSINTTHTFVSDSIILYTPPQIKTTYNASYDQAETGLLGFFGVNKASDLISTGPEAAKAFGRQIATAGLSGIAGVGDFNALKTKTSGEAVNPNLEMVFKSVPFREFSYTFEFAPRNQKELNDVQKILQLFRFHMQPEISTTSDDTYGNYLIVPSEFQLTYMYMDKQNSYIPKISRCVLKTMEIDHSPEGVFSTYKGDENGAHPVITKLTLTFGETEIMTKEKITKGF
jgi:hypothetical protein